MFGLAYDHPGISDYLSYNIPLDSIIQPSGVVPNLDVLSCGPIPSDPSELLEKDRYIELITELKERYDDVIIDTPPLHLVTDAMIIARAADVSIYVVRQGYTGKDELEFLHEIYGDDRLPNMNIIFNGIKRNKYGYGYRYDNSYYSESRHKRTFGQSMKHFLAGFKPAKKMFTPIPSFIHK
jgi:Mrp family chromosome partitioning ATPase